MTNNDTDTRDSTNQSTEATSVLKSLRSLMPSRALSYHEALQRAELQANRLLTLHGITHGPVPIEIITELPRLRVEQCYDLPVSGSAHWDGHAWVLSVNASEYILRQRFSLMHEFKHVLDHPRQQLVGGDGRTMLTAEQLSEKVADYFAACVLMPKAWVKSAFFSGLQKIEALADLFQVSPKAMSFRLNQLGLTVPADRCASPIVRTASPTGHPSWPAPKARRYFRSLPTVHHVLEGVRS